MWPSEDKASMLVYRRNASEDLTNFDRSDFVASQVSATTDNGPDSKDPNLDVVLPEEPGTGTRKKETESEISFLQIAGRIQDLAKVMKQDILDGSYHLYNKQFTSHLFKILDRLKSIEMLSQEIEMFDPDVSIHQLDELETKLNKKVKNLKKHVISAAKFISNKAWTQISDKLKYKEDPTNAAEAREFLDQKVDDFNSSNQSFERYVKSIRDLGEANKLLESSEQRYFNTYETILSLL